MTKTFNRAANLSNKLGDLKDETYARNPMVCRYCGIVADTVEKANSRCEKTGRRHFLVAA